MGFTPSGDQELAIEINADDSGASEAFDGVADSASGMKMAVAGAGAVLAGGAVAALGKSAQRAAEFEEQLTDLQKVTSESTAEGLKDDLMELSTTTRSTKEELTDIATMAGKFGIEGEKNIAQFTETVSMMNGAIESLSADEIGQRFGKISGAIDFPISNVNRLGDAVNKLADSAKTDGAEITDFMNRVGIQMKNVGLAHEEMLGLSAAMNEASTSSEKASSKMQAMIASIRDPKKVEDLAGALGMTTEEFRQMRKDDPSKLMTDISKTMKGGGEDARALRSNLTSLQRRGFESLGGTLDTFESAQKTANKQLEEGGSLAKENELKMNTWKGVMHQVKQSIDNVAIQMGDSLLPLMKTAVKEIIPLVNGFVKLNEKTDGMAGIVAAAGTALAGLGMVAVSVGPMIVGALSPILAPVLAITAAVGALYYAWKTNFGGIRTVLQNTFAVIKQTFAQSRDEFSAMRKTLGKLWAQFQVAFSKVKAILKFVVTQFVIPLVKRLRKIWANNFGEIARETSGAMRTILSVIKTVGSLISAFWDQWGDEIMQIVKTVFAYLNLTIGNALRGVLTTIKVILALIQGDWERAWGYIKEYFSRTLSDILNFLTGSFLKGLKAALSLVIGAIKAPFEAIYNWLIGNSLVPEMFNAVVEFIETTFFGGLKKALTAVFGWFKGLWNRVWGFYSGLWESIFQTTKTVLTKAYTFIKSTLTKVWNFYEGLWTKLFDFYVGIWQSIYQTTKLVLTKAYQFIDSKLSEAKQLFTNVWDTITSTITDAWNTIKTRVRNALTSLYENLKRRFDNVAQTVRTAIDTVKRTISRALNTIAQWFGDTFRSIKRAVGRIIGNLASWLSRNGKRLLRDAWNAIKRAITAVVDSLKRAIFDTMGDIVSGIISKIESGIDTVRKTFNRMIPDFLEIPQISVGGGSINIPSASFSKPDWLGGGSTTIGGDSIGIPRQSVGGQRLDLPQLAEGGIVDSRTLAMIGEAGKEAVVPLHKMSRYLDTAYEQGYQTARAPSQTAGGSQDVGVTARLRIEGDGELAELIRENARLEIDEWNGERNRRFERL